MHTVSQNGILKEEEFGKFKERTVKLRFMQQISYGVGAAMVFGLFTAMAAKLAPLAFGTSASTVVTAAGVVTIPAVAASVPAIIGLGVIASLGIGLIYLSAKFLSENTLLEQDFQAKKIGVAARGVGREVEQKPTPFPSQDKVSDMLDTAAETVIKKPSAPAPSPSVSQVELQDKVVPIDIAKARA